MTKSYPFLRGTRFLSRVASAGAAPGSWVTSPASEFLPELVLDLSIEFHRRIYLFPRAIGRYYMTSPLAALIRRELHEGAVFLDVGSNVGMFSLLAASIVGDRGRVFAFEPDPTAYSSLTRTVRHHGLENVCAVNEAVSDHDGRSLLFRAAPSDTSNRLVSQSRSALLRSQVVEVAVASIDSHFEMAPLHRLDLIKVDVEGAEADAVKGMLGTLTRTACPPIWCEVLGPDARSGSPGTYEAVKRHLTPIGYRPYRSDGVSEAPVGRLPCRRVDVLFRRDHKS